MNTATKPCIRSRLFSVVHAAVRDESVDIAALVAQTGHDERHVREVVAMLSILADADAAATTAGVSLAQALTARRQAIDSIGGAS